MLSKLLFILVLQMFIFDCEVTSYGYSRNYRPRYKKSDTNWQKNKHHHSAAKSRVVMPSGNTYYITTPHEARRWKCGDKSKLINLDPKRRSGRKEFTIVKKELEAMWGGSFAGHEVLKVQKIENTCLWRKYQYRKKEVIMEAKTANELMLFHGSPAIMDLVDKGFDERFAKITGYLGAGLYFASHSAKSHVFTKLQADGTRLMLLCRVTMGRIHLAHAGQTYPHAPARYHSVKGDMAHPEFIVYRGEQAYPEYLITYK